MNYEAYDEIKDVEIYNGTSRDSLIEELTDYINFQNHIDEELITETEIENLDNKALKRLGIVLHINKW
jgi:hypothetical protein